MIIERSLKKSFNAIFCYLKFGSLLFTVLELFYFKHPLYNYNLILNVSCDAHLSKVTTALKILCIPHITRKNEANFFIYKIISNNIFLYKKTFYFQTRNNVLLSLRYPWCLILYLRTYVRYFGYSNG